MKYLEEWFLRIILEQVNAEMAIKAFSVPIA